MKQAVVLLSSGLDSAANLILGDIAPSQFRFKPVLALTVNYGQRSAARELQQAAHLAKHFATEHLSINVSEAFPLLAGVGSALLGSQDIPHVANDKLDDLGVTRASARAVWVPNRNGMLLNMAAAAAEARGLGAVVVGFNAEEAVTFPDNGVPFMDATTKALSYSTANGVTIMSATAQLNKKEIVARLDALEFPFHLLWSCYEAGRTHCGRCESCERLKRAVTLGVSDTARRNRTLAEIFGL